MQVFRLSLGGGVQYPRRTEFCRIFSVLTEYLLIVLFELLEELVYKCVYIILFRPFLLWSVAHLFKPQVVVLFFVCLLCMTQQIFCLEIRCCH
jgi:hypothetical protein